MSLFWFATLLLSHAPFISLQQEENPVLTHCYGPDNYTSNSQFQANLISSLLPSLASEGPINSTTYYSATVGQGSDRVYGFAQCMSAPNMTDCRDCLNRSVAGIVRQCPSRKQALVRYYNCILHYSNQSFLFQLDTSLVVYAWPVANVTEPALFNKQLGDLMRNLSYEATTAPSRFAVGITSYSDFDNIYGLAQCTRDLSRNDCFSCLNSAIGAINTCCRDKQGGNVYFPSCNIRYEIYPFYPAFGLATPPPPAIDAVANVTEPALFNEKLGLLLRNLSYVATTVPSRIAVGNTNYTDFDNIYGREQCSRDLSSSDCYSCLNRAIEAMNTCCRDKQAGNVNLRNCNIRYENYAFDPAFVLAAPPSQPSLPPPPYARFDFPPFEHDAGTSNDRRRSIILGVTVAVISALIIIICLLWVARKKRLRGISDSLLEENIEDSKQLLYDLREIRAATNNFSDANKLGQGGFGPVYKGILRDGQEIAVKRHLATSSQGITELRNEITLVAKLQHRNLVKLLGCCLEEQEKLLIYEFVPNTSLEKFLFDPVKRALLRWEIRNKIIGGIARGLLYLHEDSRLKIIHRDLKASNILLDMEMRAKISDFGLAKIFGEDQTQGNTGRIVGTYGYMAPEYAMHGHFSTKSDVYSFGVLVLEIVTGQKNSGFNEFEGATNLLTHVWKHWKRGSFSELIDGSLGEDCPRNEILRCAHIGLLCVQEDAIERPTMSTVGLMLSGHYVILPAPSPPAFCLYRSRIDSNTLGSEMQAPINAPSRSTSSTTPNSVNDVSMSDFYPR